MGYEVSTDPVDDACVYVGNLKEVAVLWVPGTSSAVDDFAHPPVFALRIARLVVVPHDDCHPWFDIQEQVYQSLLRRCRGLLTSSSSNELLLVCWVPSPRATRQ